MTSNPIPYSLLRELDENPCSAKSASSFVVKAIDQPNNLSKDLIFDHWKQAWKSHVKNGLDFQPNARDILNDFLADAASQNLHHRTLIARDTSTQEIVGSIECQVWNGPVPIGVIDPDVFCIGTLWGLNIVHEQPLELERSDEVANALIAAALLHLRRHKCQKAVVLTLDERSQTYFVDAGFHQGNMLTLPLSNELVDIGDFVNSFQILKEGVNSDNVVCSHWHKMWREVGIPESGLVPKFDEVTHSFLSNARKRLGYQTIVARSRDGTVIGSVSCQIWEGPFPKIVKPAIFQYGTVWAVYVIPEMRRQGVATALMRSALMHLREQGCDTAVLVSASQAGQAVYERLGFASNNALVYDLSDAPNLCPKSSKPIEPPPEQAFSEELGDRLSSVGIEGMNTGILLALATATTQQIEAVFDHDKQMLELIIQAVSDIQRKNGIYVDPNDNWFTQNVKRFGHGFDMKKLCDNPKELASKFDRLSTYYDHWTVGNCSKVERFIVSCARNRLSLGSESQKLRLLDVACGIGLQGQTLRMCGYQGDLVGNDISSGMIARVTARGCYNNAYVANANESLLIDTKSSDIDDQTKFDVILCTGAMELLDQPTALSNMAATLKPGGEIWVSFQYQEENSSSPQNPTGHQNVRGISKTTAMQQLTDAGFVIVSAEVCRDAFFTPSPAQDGELLPVPYLFVVAQNIIQISC